MKNSTPLFTVATITYNSGKWVRQTIESILASSYENFELIISDDCSSDDTWEIIQQYKDPRIRAWRNETNLGEYPNRNHALQLANGRYIIYVDGDDMLYPQTLRNLSEYIASWPQAVSIWGVWSDQMSFCFFPVLLQSIETMRWIYAANLPISIMGFGETVFKTEALKAAGGFSDEFISGDMYIKKRVALNGSVLLIPLGMMFWRKSEMQATKKLSQNLTGYQNNVLIDRIILTNPFFKNYPADRDIFLHNCKVRDIKLLVRHTLLKGKILLWWQLMKKLNYSLSDLHFIFNKADFSYLNELHKQIYSGEKSEVI